MDEFACHVRATIKDPAQLNIAIGGTIGVKQTHTYGNNGDFLSFSDIQLTWMNLVYIRFILFI